MMKNEWKQSIFWQYSLCSVVNQGNHQGSSVTRNLKWCRHFSPGAVLCSVLIWKMCGLLPTWPTLISNKACNCLKPWKLTIFCLRFYLEERFNVNLDDFGLKMRPFHPCRSVTTIQHHIISHRSLTIYPTN